MKIINVGSGSSGNSTLIYDGKTLLMIDAGLALTRVKNCLETLGKGPSDILALLLTHGHIDHVKHQDKFKDEIRFGPEDIVSNKQNALKPYVIYRFGTFEVTPVKLSHDVTCFGYILFSNYTKEKVVYITDTGFIPEKTLELSNDADYYIFESNHDTTMEMKSNRPIYLIKRNISSTGHLNNYDSSYYLSCLVGEKTKAIMFAHISRDCNTVEHIKSAYEEVFIAQRGKVMENIEVYYLKQDEPTYIRELVK
ncbi:MAG TPA: MBL fold metallo-hydrolase [Firmicutes bacterium]|nr:MBL fold metallo-hydrolase [Bacillota bacterium]